MCNIGLQAWPLWIGVIGIIAEFIGFGFLGFEIIQTNRKSLEEARLLARQADFFGALIIDGGNFSDPNSGKVEVQGGFAGLLRDRVPIRENDLAKSRRIIWFGITISGFGVMLQIVSALGQAMCNPGA